MLSLIFYLLFGKVFITIFCNKVVITYFLGIIIHLGEITELHSFEMSQLVNAKITGMINNQGLTKRVLPGVFLKTYSWHS